MGCGASTGNVEFGGECDDVPSVLPPDSEGVAATNSPFLTEMRRKMIVTRAKLQHGITASADIPDEDPNEYFLEPFEIDQIKMHIDDTIQAHLRDELQATTGVAACEGAPASATLPDVPMLQSVSSIPRLNAKSSPSDGDTPMGEAQLPGAIQPSQQSAPAPTKKRNSGGSLDGPSSPTSAFSSSKKYLWSDNNLQSPTLGPSIGVPTFEHVLDMKSLRQCYASAAATLASAPTNNGSGSSLASSPCAAMLFAPLAFYDGKHKEQLERRKSTVVDVNANIAGGSLASPLLSPSSLGGNGVQQQQHNSPSFNGGNSTGTAPAFLQSPVNEGVNVDSSVMAENNSVSGGTATSINISLTTMAANNTTSTIGHSVTPTASGNVLLPFNSPITASPQTPSMRTTKTLEELGEGIRLSSMSLNTTTIQWNQLVNSYRSSTKKLRGTPADPLNFVLTPQFVFFGRSRLLARQEQLTNTAMMLHGGATSTRVASNMDWM